MQKACAGLELSPTYANIDIYDLPLRAVCRTEVMPMKKLLALLLAALLCCALPLGALAAEPEAA